MSVLKFSTLKRVCNVYSKFIFMLNKRQLKGKNT